MAKETKQAKAARIAAILSSWEPVVVQLANGQSHIVTKADMLRFLMKTEVVANGCWRWTAGCNAKNYGVFRIGNKQTRAHRFAYAVFIGPIPANLHVDHYCHTRAIQAGTCDGGTSCEHRRCVHPDPDHLRPATPAENTLSSLSFVAENKQKTHCINGHAFEGDDLYIYPNGDRGCKECRRIAGRRWYRQQAAKAGREVQSRDCCPNGHPYDAETTSRDSKGQRQCRICRRVANKRNKLRAKERSGRPDRSNGNKTHCKHGHEFTAENTRVTVRKTPTGEQRVRICRACEAAYEARRKSRVRGRSK